MDDDANARYRDQEEISTRDRAGLLGLEYFDSRQADHNAPLSTGLMTVPQMYSGKIVPLAGGDEEHGALFGITAATPQSLLRSLREEYQNSGKNISFVLMSNSGFNEFMRRFDPPKEVVYQDVKIGADDDNKHLNQVSQTLETVKSDDILNYLITQADRLGASDIHLENQRENTRVRFRIDGTLHPIASLSHDKYRVLQASIASKANISTAANEPQTGHMQQMMTDNDGKERLLNMRIETVPASYGQDAVIRMFSFDESLLKLDRLGLTEVQRQPIEEVIKHPHGLVLVVGPTGSGKSTTLFSIITALNQPDRKIITLEDPVEISLPGVTQIPVNTDKGASFADQLRTVLRLDPDVIMVGEIRDADTAKTAIQASITGHLVVATFHASSAAAAFSRLLDMIGHNPVFNSAIRLVIGQRLVRRLDDTTKQQYDPDEQTRDWLQDNLKDLPEAIEKPDFSGLKLYKPGSSEENPFGYKGRILLMEQMVVAGELQNLLKNSKAEINTEAIEVAARKQGMVTMLEDGLLRTVRGETTIEEVNRVV